LFRLSVCAETVFQAFPFIERVRKIAQAGFAVEFWRREEADIQAVCAEPSVCVSTFSASDEGGIMHPDSAQVFLRGVKRRVEFARRLRCRELNLLSGSLSETGAGDHPIAANPITRWVTAYKCLCRVAELAEEHDVIFNLESLNAKTDHPGYSLTRIEDAARLIDEVGSPRVKILFDVYHAAIEEGNVIQLIRDYHAQIGYIHVADVPGRHEPGTGEINYAQVARALADVSYHGAVGLEAYPLDDDERALRSFRETFTLSQ
jgi:hydroxypyruvate isomerase